ncbi:MAG: PIN domain-containing protein [Cocleimonas sp.]|nr:PIN domain-containing protein [Cocleimonas sp.]
MVLIDTSIWINVLGKRKSKSYTQNLQDVIGGRDIVLTRFQQLEILQGCSTEKEWGKLSEYLDGQDYLETLSTTWQSAARIFYELRKKGLTVRSPIDCCIAQIAIEQRVLLIHNDRDFDVIGKHFPLRHLRIM